MRSTLQRARRMRDANGVLVSVAVAVGAAFLPFVALVREEVADPSAPVLALSWWAGTAILCGYGGVHVLAAAADTERFLQEYGTEYGSAGLVFCHALGQRLFVLVASGFALVAFALLGTGVGAPPALLVVLGLFGAMLLAPPTAIPVNRRISERLEQYDD